MKINLFFIILLILLNLFSLYTYYSILENEREKMAESIQSILSGIDPNNFQDENERRMFAQISGKEKDYEKYIDKQKLENKLSNINSIIKYKFFFIVIFLLFLSML